MKPLLPLSSTSGQKASSARAREAWEFVAVTKQRTIIRLENDVEPLMS